MTDAPPEKETELLAVNTQGRRALVRRRPSAPSRDAAACCHLGLEGDPFAHFEEPASEHRCYLWMQRDRIDLTHQEIFCLTPQSVQCPWLAISAPPMRQPLHQRAAQALADRLSNGFEDAEGSWQRTLLAALFSAAVLIGRGAAAGWRLAQPLLLAALLLLGRALVWPIIWLAQHYRAIERVALSGLAALGRALWAAARATARWAFWQGRKAFRPRIRGAPPEAAPGPAAHSAATLVAPNAGPSGIPLAATDPAAARLCLRRGMEAVRDGDAALALYSFRLATTADERDEQAWLWRGALADSADEKEECFRRALAINPHSARARVGLTQLGAEALSYPGGATQAAAAAAPGDGGAVSPPQASDAADLAVSWRCPACAAINPRSADTCQRCARPSPQIERELVGGDGFLKGGLEAMRAGNEERAYHYFSLAAENEPSNEHAWYWRAKTAPNLDELIRCLERIVDMNPANAKAQADLLWARQRRQREQAQEAQRKAASIAPQPASAPPRLISLLRHGLLQLASVCTFLLALLLSLPSVLSLTDLPAVPAYRSYLSLLPSFRLPELSVQTEFAPAFDLGAALPLVVALLLFHSAFRLSDGGGRGTRIWTALLAAAAVPLLLLYVTNAPASTVGVALALAAIAAALAGEAEAGRPPVHGLRGSNGVAMVELALILPSLMLILLGIVDLGRVFYTYEALANGAREGARYCALHPGDDAIYRVTAELDGRVTLNESSIPCANLAQGTPTSVTISSTFTPITPFMSNITGGPMAVSASATMVVWR